MRKIVVISMVTLDGVIQAPGGPTEDTSDGFKYGGWTVPYVDDFSMKIVMDQMTRHPYDLLLGRKTYDIWANYWPRHTDNPIGEAFGKATKYVATHTPLVPIWEKTVVLKGDAAEAIKELKTADGPELQVQGSGNLIQTLLKNDLVDEMYLRIFPITLGSGKKLFQDGTIPAAFTLQSCEHSPSGVIFANYKRAGEVKTGSFD